MKAILASGNLTQVNGGVESAEKMIGKSRKDISIAIINEAAGVEFGDHRWAIEAMRELVDTFGGNIEIVHLLAINPEQVRARCMAADMIYMLGGNTDWLRIVFDKTGFSKILPEILKNKLYVGSSAGAMILGHQPSYETQVKMYGEYYDFGVKNYLDLLDFSILPHLNDRGINNENLAIAESENVDYPVYAISDNAAVVVDDKEVFVIGNGYLKLLRGKVF